MTHVVEFERLAADRYSERQIGAGGNKETVIWRIEHGYLPGFETDAEARLPTSVDVVDDIADPFSFVFGPNGRKQSIVVLWMFGRWDVAKALARQIAGKGPDAVAFAVLDRAELWESSGKFESVPDGWACFDYPYYLVVRNKGDYYLACLMRRLYEWGKHAAWAQPTKPVGGVRRQGERAAYGLQQSK